jgi:hypothetical protein
MVWKVLTCNYALLPSDTNGRTKTGGCKGAKLKKATLSYENSTRTGILLQNRRSTNKLDTFTIFGKGHLQAKTGIIVTALTTAIVVIASIAIIITLNVTSPANENLAFAQGSNEFSSSITPLNETGANLTTTTVPTLTTPGAKEFYLFRSEIPDVDEEKLKVAGDAFSIPTMIVNKADNVTVHFYSYLIFVS